MHQQQNMCFGKSGKVFAIGKNNFVFLKSARRKQEGYL
jgi:hypothetical protein